MECRRHLVGTLIIMFTILKMSWTLTKQNEFQVTQQKCSWPPNFSLKIKLYSRTYENWPREINLPSVWIAVPHSAQDVVDLANWALLNNYRLRAYGTAHNFSPLTLSEFEVSQLCPRVILVDTKENLKSMSLHSDKGGSYVQVETGALLETVLQYLETNGYGIFAAPAIGEVAIGGLLAVGSHGTGIPGTHDSKSDGHTYGSLSNLIINMTIVAWDHQQTIYVLKSIHRSEKDCKAFLVHIGRAFVTSVSLRIGKNQNLRKFSPTYSTAEIFAPPTKTNPSSTTTVAQLANKYGRVQTIVLPFSKVPWVQISHAVQEKPNSSKLSNNAYPYIFMNYVPSFIGVLAEKLVTRFPAIARTIGMAAPSAIQLGMKVTGTQDLWGPSKNSFLYIKSATVHLSIAGYAIVTSQENLQKVLHLIKTNFEKLLDEFAARGEYPINAFLDIRISGVDNPLEINVEKAEAPTLSASTPVEGKPHFNRVVWMDLCNIPHTPKHFQFKEQFEIFLFNVFNGDWALARPEWSKGWAYTGQKGFVNETVLKHLIPKFYSTTQKDNGWAWAISRFNYYDPHKIFTNEFLEKLFSDN